MNNNQFLTKLCAFMFLFGSLSATALADGSAQLNVGTLQSTTRLFVEVEDPEQEEICWEGTSRVRVRCSN